MLNRITSAVANADSSTNDEFTTFSQTIAKPNVVGSASCHHGYKGACCCNCKNQLKLYSHPLNADFGKGSIMQQCGWACVNPEICEGESAIFFDKEHGMCECWSLRS